MSKTKPSSSSLDTDWLEHFEPWQDGFLFDLLNLYDIVILLILLPR